jgi:hypothetical protein
MKINLKHRNIWKNLGLALATTPIVVIVGLIVITLVGALDDLITKIQRSGHWWILLIVGYVLSLIYCLVEPKYRQDRFRDKYVSSLLLHWEIKTANQNKAHLPPTEFVREQLTERIKIWGYYPGEKYSEDPFEIVDGFLTKYFPEA